MKTSFCALGLAVCVAFHAGAQPITNYLSSNNITWIPLLSITNVPVGDTATVQYGTLQQDQSIVWSNLTSLKVTQSPLKVVDDEYTAGRQYRVLDSVPIITSNPPPSGALALIPAGVFQMGDAIDGNVPRSIHVSAFFMDTNLVTLALWQQVLQSAAGSHYSITSIAKGKGGNYPVENVSWND